VVSRRPRRPRARGVVEATYSRFHFAPPRALPSEASLHPP